MTYIKILWANLLIDVAMRAADKVFKIVFWYSETPLDGCLNVTAVNTVAEVEEIQFGLTDAISLFLGPIIKTIKKILILFVLCILRSVVHIIIIFGLNGQKILDEFTDHKLDSLDFYFNARSENALYEANMKIDGGCLAH